MLNTIKEKLESFKSKFNPLAVVLRWVWAWLKWSGITIGSLYIGFKWVQAEFKAIAKEEVSVMATKFETYRSADLQHLDKRFDGLDKRFDRIETLITTRK
jgi:hypothetical protein